MGYWDEMKVAGESSRRGKVNGSNSFWFHFFPSSHTFTRVLRWSTRLNAHEASVWVKMAAKQVLDVSLLNTKQKQSLEQVSATRTSNRCILLKIR